MNFNTRLLHGAFPPDLHGATLPRVSVGLEDIEDLKEDFAQAISKINESGDYYGG